MSAFRCIACGQALATPGSLSNPTIGTGYGLDRHGFAVCYACCAVKDERDMLATGKATLYLTKRADGIHELTNWPGSLRIGCYGSLRRSRHNIARWRYDIRFSFRGDSWVATQYGDNVQIAHCRRVIGAR